MILLYSRGVISLMFVRVCVCDENSSNLRLSITLDRYKYNRITCFAYTLERIVYIDA